MRGVPLNSSSLKITKITSKLYQSCQKRSPANPCLFVNGCVFLFFVILLPEQYIGTWCRQAPELYFNQSYMPFHITFFVPYSSSFKMSCWKMKNFFPLLCHVFLFILRAMGMGMSYTLFKAWCVVQCKQSWTDIQRLLCCITSINGTVGQSQMINGGRMENSMLVLSKNFKGLSGQARCVYVCVCVFEREREKAWPTYWSLSGCYLFKNQYCFIYLI